jgi:hypothetical protein
MHFTQTKKFFSKNSSQTAQMHAKKLDINHLKIEKVLWRTKELKIGVLTYKESKHIISKMQKLKWQKLDLSQNLIQLKDHKQDNL